MDEIYHIPLFEGISDQEFQWLREHSREFTLLPGEFFFRENEPGEHFYIVLDGEMQITRTVNGTERVMGTTPRGIIGGEISLLNGEPSVISACAILPTRLLVLEAPDFRELFGALPTVGARILQIATQRLGGYASIVGQQEKMAALGKFAAGLAHELNNPASAVRRAARNLTELLPTMIERTVNLNKLGLNDGQIRGLILAQQDAIRHGEDVPVLSAIERSDREDALAAWMEDAGVEDAWELAPTFVTAGVSADDLQTLLDTFPEKAYSDILCWLESALNIAALLRDTENSTQRISELVRAVKEYTYMDQGTLQEVDLHKALENTLRIMAYKLKSVQVVRQYDPELPTMVANGSELNQVWTNLIDNAIDAMDSSGTLELITRWENQYAMVEIADSGPGIPEDVLPHIFEPFFTTKAVGSGTGLGLDIVYRIVQQHNGTIHVEQIPGRTRFIVRLPLNDTVKD
jgi:signal transduction histidine kinase